MCCIHIFFYSSNSIMAYATISFFLYYYFVLPKRTKQIIARHFYCWTTSTKWTWKFNCKSRGPKVVKTHWRGLTSGWDVDAERTIVECFRKIPYLCGIEAIVIANIRLLDVKPQRYWIIGCRTAIWKVSTIRCAKM